MNAEGGYTRQYRRLWDNPVFRNKQEAAVFSWMKDVAAWRPTAVKTRFGVIALAIGELLMTERQVADDFGIDRKRLRNLLQRMVAQGMIAIGGFSPGTATRTATRTAHGTAAGTIVTIRNYVEYQSLRVRPNGSAEPVEEPVEEPPRNRYRDRSIDNEEERRKESKSPPPVVPPRAVGDAQPGAVVAVQVKTERKKTRRPERLEVPTDWEPGPEGWDYAATKAGWEDGRASEEVEGFRDHHRAKGSRLSDLDAAWRIWVRNDVKFQGRRGHGQGTPSPGYSLMQGFFEAGQEWDSRHGDCGAGCPPAPALLDGGRHAGNA
jgi:hypothetical protein